MKYCEGKQSIVCIYNSIQWSPVYNILIFIGETAHPCPIKCNSSRLKRGNTVPCRCRHGHLRRKKTPATLEFEGWTVKVAYNERYALWSLFMTDLFYSTFITEHWIHILLAFVESYVTFPSSLLSASNKKAISLGTVLIKLLCLFPLKSSTDRLMSQKK
jgi:hypothetical protein